MNLPAKSIRTGKSPLFFGTASLILILETHLLIPFIAKSTGRGTVHIWFLVAGLGMFLPMLIILLPILFVESYVVQRRQNTWLGVLIHTSINDPFFGHRACFFVSFLV